MYIKYLVEEIEKSVFSLLDDVTNEFLIQLR